jgi:NAD(P)-dependent dehydrogenase (short-subunit alcohol dehydrogenase family)
MSFANKVALVTGAGSGIGKAAAVRLAAEGCAVGVLTHTAKEAEAVADEIRAAGGKALALTADVSDADQMTRAVDDLEQEFGRVDLLFANAGINGV